MADDEAVYDTHGRRIDDDYIARAVDDVHSALAGRPSLSGSSGTSPQIAFRVSTITREKAEQLAQAEGISLSEFARHALEESIDRHTAA